MPEQDVGAFQQFAQSVDQLAVEHAVERQLGFQPQFEAFAEFPHDPAQHVRAERQVFDIEFRAGGEHREALPQQLQGAGRPLRLAADDLHQHDVAVDVGVGHQGQGTGGEGAGRRGRHMAHARLAQLGQGVPQCVQEQRGELCVDLVQAPGLGIDVGLDLAVARALGIAEQLALQFDDGQFQRGGQGLRGQRVQRRQQAAHARRRGHVGETGRVGLGR